MWAESLQLARLGRSVYVPRLLVCLFLCTAFKCTRWCFSLTRCAAQTVRKFKLKKDVPPLTKWTFIWNSLRHQLPKWNFETRGHIFSGHVAERNGLEPILQCFFFHLCRHTVGMGHLPHCHNLKDIRTFTIKHWKVPTIYVLGPQVPPWILQKVLFEHGDHGGTPSTYMIGGPSSIALMIPVRFTWGWCLFCCSPFIGKYWAE